MKKNQERLSQEIEELRRLMIQSAECLGLGHPQVLKYSQELDAVYTLSMKHRYSLNN